MLSDLAIRRPVLAAVASLLIIVFGIGVLGSLPVRELPDIDTAVVTVTTTYRGAAPEIIDTDITEVVEGSVAGVAGVKTISSSSRRGRSRVVVEFEVGNDIDAAANDVREAVAGVERRLPDGVEEVSVVKADDNAGAVSRGDPEFLAIDGPLIAVSFSLGLKGSRIRAGCGLAQRKRSTEKLTAG